MDEGGDGGRTLHRVGQPHLERHLGGLADGAAEQEQGDEPAVRQDARSGLRRECLTIRKVIGPLCPLTAFAAGIHPNHSGGKVGDRTPGCESFSRGCPPHRYAALIGTSPLVATWNRRTRDSIANSVPSLLRLTPE